MKKRMMKNVALLLAAASLMGLAACGTTEPASDTTADTTTAETTEAVTEAVYPYDTTDLGGYEFTFLNLDKCSWASRLLVPEEATGELVSDAMYERNSRVEEKLNITIREEVASSTELPNLIKAAVNSGDDVYDVTLCPNHYTGGLLLDGYFVDLNSVDSLNLDEAWWDQTVIDEASLGDHCYFATSDLSLFPFEATMVMFFNKEKMDKLNLDYPYELAADGKWTLDALTECAKEAANLNGQDTYAYDKEKGTADYGVLAHSQFMEVLVFGSGETYLDNSGDIPVFAGTSERLNTVFEKIVQLTSTEGAYLDRDVAKLTEGVVYGFKANRAMFMTECLGHIANLRDSEIDFGVLPIPKLDENQDQYYSMVASMGPLMTTIPQSCSDAERAGLVLDLLSWESSISLMEPYYDAYLTQKGVRDDGSAEMLQIIRDSRTINVGKMFDWTTAVLNSVNASLTKGEGAVSSTIAGYETSVNAAIKATFDRIK